jgi:hypothetical protein
MEAATRTRVRDSQSARNLGAVMRTMGRRDVKTATHYQHLELKTVPVALD